MSSSALIHRTEESLADYTHAHAMRVSVPYPEQLVRDLLADVIRRRDNNDATHKAYAELVNEQWCDDVPPGGYICGTCGVPVEDEPCLAHGGSADVVNWLRSERKRLRDNEARLEKELADLREAAAK